MGVYFLIAIASFLSCYFSALVVKVVDIFFILKLYVWYAFDLEITGLMDFTSVYFQWNLSILTEKTVDKGFTFCLMHPTWADDLFHYR